ncbi:MAG: TAXI family TRAP transporter solute-binding subunit [Hyphomicrobiales bacterium]|nr:TAXI family TRAP transporter solute-binding subunit [Hyphomicrobiales bacterium]MCP5371133.1 TAXI family TRAP transporter solute-binding subunit [Hyphomicrobiales bacterium]
MATQNDDDTAAADTPPKRNRRRDLYTLFLPAVLLTLAGFVLAYQFVQPAPPGRITIATGGPAGAYYGFGQQYRAFLAAEGVELEVRQTKGSVENLDLLDDPAAGVAAALVQGGTGDPSAHPGLRALASLYFEPLWVFVRAEGPFETLADLRDMRLAVGAVGSGTRVVADQLLAANGLAPPAVRLAEITGMAAVDALVAGKVDAAFFVASAKSEAVARLLTAPGISLLSFRRAGAYTRRHRFLSEVVLPEGVIDLAANLPPRDVTLLAPAATLVVRDDLHPALVNLLMQAAQAAHRDGGLFEAAGQFPSGRFLDFPIHDEARRFLKSGPPFLQRYLPFWAATLIERLLVMLLPLVTLLIPLVRAFPPFYRWRIRSRIYRWYGRLQAIDDAARRPDGPDRAETLAAIDRLEADVMRVTVPLSYADELYSLRRHIDFVRNQARKPVRYD